MHLFLIYIFNFFVYPNFLYINVTKKKNTKTNTITPAGANLNTAEKIVPSKVLNTLKPIAVIIVLLKDKFSFNAQSPGNTNSATTRIVPMTLMDNTIVMATSKSKIIDKRLVGTPIIRESSSSKTIDNNSRLKIPTNNNTAEPNIEINAKSIESIVNMEPKR